MSCAGVADSAAVAPPADDRAIRALFDGLFRVTERTVLCGGAAEPLYEPWPSQPDDAADEAVLARIHYREDYVASALHEVAHWCIAGRARRGVVDYGYWYAPDGRDAGEQVAFMQVEARPQALEWLFSRACRLPFAISFDNLDAPPSDREGETFAAAVVAAAQHLVTTGLPPRAARFYAACAGRFGGPPTPTGLSFSMHEVWP